MTTTRIYIGGLPGDIREGEVEDIFARYGRIRSIDIKGGRDERSAFAFVDFTDDRDADEACYREHGRTFAGGRLRVCPYPLVHAASLRLGAATCLPCLELFLVLQLGA